MRSELEGEACHLLDQAVHISSIKFTPCLLIFSVTWTFRVEQQGHAQALVYLRVQLAKVSRDNRHMQLLMLRYDQKITIIVCFEKFRIVSSLEDCARTISTRNWPQCRTTCHVACTSVTIAPKKPAPKKPRKKII